MRCSSVEMEMDLMMGSASHANCLTVSYMIRSINSIHTIKNTRFYHNSLDDEAGNSISMRDSTSFIILSPVIHR